MKAGLGDFEALIVRPSSGERVSAVEFKTAVLKLLVDDGWTIVAIVGYHESDLSGGYAEN